MTATPPAERVDTSTGEIDPAPQVRPFAGLLQELQHGVVHDEASYAVRDLVAAVAATGKKGSVTLIVSVAPAGRSDNTFEVAGRVTSKLPEPEHGSSIFYTDSHDNLTRRDPRQAYLPLTGLDGSDD